MGRSPRSVLVGMGETAGWCGQLVVGLRAIGLRADLLDLGPDPHGYTAERPLRARVVRWLADRRRSGPGPRAAWTALHRLGMAWLFVHAVVRYDAFVFRAGDSFFNLRDLALLRRLGRPVLVVFFGSDSRPPYLNGAEVDRHPTGNALVAETVARRRMVEHTEREAGAIVCHVMSAQLHTRRSIAFLAVGIPRAPRDVAARPLANPVRALHAPSHGAGKGTELVRAAVDTAREAGARVELEVIHGRPNAEVLTAIERCDFVIDQPYSDTPMAAFAAEAAARGRPAIVGGLGWDELRVATPAELLPPAHLCHPDQLADAVERLATDHAYRAELGERARVFVGERWSPASVAERVLLALRGEAPEAWTFEPGAVVHPYGAGQSEARTGEAVRTVIDAAGVAGLRVADKPQLERSLVELATEGDR